MGCTPGTSAIRCCAARTNTAIRALAWPNASRARDNTAATFHAMRIVPAPSWKTLKKTCVTGLASDRRRARTALEQAEKEGRRYDPDTIDETLLGSTQAQNRRGESHDGGHRPVSWLGRGIIRAGRMNEKNGGDPKYFSLSAATRELRTRVLYQPPNPPTALLQPTAHQRHRTEKEGGGGETQHLTNALCCCYIDVSPSIRGLSRAVARRASRLGPTLSRFAPPPSRYGLLWPRSAAAGEFHLEAQ
eukprot:COSAG05_NODE_2228_length_3363_cov_1.655331_3_plen_246_part_00